MASYDPGRHHRRSIRLPAYDYASAGAYFVTVVTYRREPLLGRIEAGVMRRSAYGHIADEEWWRSAELRSNVELRTGEFIVMPDHIHGIIHIALLRGTDGGIVADGRPVRDPTDDAPVVGSPTDVDVDVDVGAQRRCAPTSGTIAATGVRHVPERFAVDDRTRPHVIPGSLGAIVRAYKSIVTRRINEARRTPGLLVWQRNYYERVIRDDDEHDRIRSYIVNNPARWSAGPPPNAGRR